MPAQCPEDEYPIRSDGSPYTFADGESLSSQEFLSAVAATAEQLPQGRYAINLCDDRQEFATGFFAALLRGQTNILLPGLNDAVRESALQSFADAYELTGAHIRAASSTTAADPRPGLEQLAQDHIAAIVFSSGTTGLHKQIVKTWRSLLHGARVNARCLSRHLPPGASMVATVPTWHMYGLEWSVMLPLVLHMSASRQGALFPDDIRERLEEADGPRVLLSTPVHLRALLEAEMKLPPLDLVMSATAPLDQDLARNLEQRWSTKVLEVYGCSELGSMAIRLPVRDQHWQFLPEFSYSVADEVISVAADHTGPAVELADQLEFAADGCFSIVGRQSDMVKVAGKRGSLADITACLHALPGVVDGVVYDPQQQGLPETGRLAAVVAVQPGVTSADVRSGLQGKVDPAFIPRPVHLVDAIPRNETGKLSQATLLDLLADIAERSGRHD